MGERWRPRLPAGAHTPVEVLHPRVGMARCRRAVTTHCIHYPAAPWGQGARSRLVQAGIGDLSAHTGGHHSSVCCPWPAGSNPPCWSESPREPRPHSSDSVPGKPAAPLPWHTCPHSHLPALHLPALHSLAPATHLPTHTHLCTLGTHHHPQHTHTPAALAHSHTCPHTPVCTHTPAHTHT